MWSHCRYGELAVFDQQCMLLWELFLDSLQHMLSELNRFISPWDSSSITISSCGSHMGVLTVQQSSSTSTGSSSS
jgi:hypothetical protein